MDEKKIEEMLRKAWTPRTPDGMRERVLARSQSSRKSIFSLPAWKAALASAAVLVVLISGIADSARQARISQMVDAPRSSGMSSIMAQGVTPNSHRWMMNRFLALNSLHELELGSEGDNLP